MTRFTHIICLLLMLGLGLTFAGNAYADNAQDMAGCCDPETMHMMQAGNGHAPEHDCMDENDCPPGGLCCDTMAVPATGVIRELPVEPDQQCDHTLLSYVSDLPLRAAPNNHTAPPPIA